MTLSDFFAGMTLTEKDAEVIFDRAEPIGQPTDLVLPRHRWFRKDSPATPTVATTTLSVSR